MAMLELLKMHALQKDFSRAPLLLVSTVYGAREISKGRSVSDIFAGVGCGLMPLLERAFTVAGIRIYPTFMYQVVEVVSAD